MNNNKIKHVYEAKYKPGRLVPSTLKKSKTLYQCVDSSSFPITCMGQQEVCVRGRTKVLGPPGPGIRAAWLLTTELPLQPTSAHFYCYLPFAWASSSHLSSAWQKTMWLSFGSSKNSFPAGDSPPCRWNSVHIALPPTKMAAMLDFTAAPCVLFW